MKRRYFALILCLLIAVTSLCVSASNTITFNENNFKYMLYMNDLKYRTSTEMTTETLQANTQLGLLKSPGQVNNEYNVLTYQANRREAKSELMLNYFTENNKLYRYLIKNGTKLQKQNILTIKDKVTQGMSYYIDASIERSLNNPNDCISINTPFWELNGKGNAAMYEALTLIDAEINSLRSE